MEEMKVTKVNRTKAVSKVKTLQHMGKGRGRNVETKTKTGNDIADESKEDEKHSRLS